MFAISSLRATICFQDSRFRRLQEASGGFRRVQGAGCRVQGAGCRVSAEEGATGEDVQGSGFIVFLDPSLTKPSWKGLHVGFVINAVFSRARTGGGGGGVSRPAGCAKRACR
jgi:hypothetical protein